MDEIKAQKKALKKAYKKAKRKTVLAWKILTILCAVLMVVFIPLSKVLTTFDTRLQRLLVVPSGSWKTRTPTHSTSPVTSLPRRRWWTTVSCSASRSRPRAQPCS